MTVRLFNAKTLSISIARSVPDVYAFVSHPPNLPQWARGLGQSVRPDAEGRWWVETSDGPRAVRFSERNAFGILDHFVRMSADTEVYVPMRAISNGEGTELLFTVFQLPDMSDEHFARDADAIMRDLRELKRLLEKKR